MGTNKIYFLQRCLICSKPIRDMLQHLLMHQHVSDDYLCSSSSSQATSSLSQSMSTVSNWLFSNEVLPSQQSSCWTSGYSLRAQDIAFGTGLCMTRMHFHSVCGSSPCTLALVHSQYENVNHLVGSVLDFPLSCSLCTASGKTCAHTECSVLAACTSRGSRHDA